MQIVEPPTPRAAVPAWSAEVDVVVIGLGVAGVCAALEAHRAGADVLVIERSSSGGGASANSEGIFYLGGGTTLQRDLGIDDTVDNLYAFMRASTSTPDDDALRTFCTDSPAHFDWLERQGVPFERGLFTDKAVSARDGDGLLYTGNEKAWPFRNTATPAPRGHQSRASRTQAGGASAMRALLETFEGEDIPVRYDSRVVALVVDDDAVVGVKVRSAGDDEFVAARRGVVIAAGSFNVNRDITMEHIPAVAEHGQPLGIGTNDGAGLLLGRTVGAAEAAMDGAIATASIYPPAQLVKGIVVNCNGERFVAEDVYHGRLGWFVEQQPGHRAFLIVDEEIFAYPKVRSHRLVDGWETVAEMEAGLEMPAGALQRTLDEYNADARRGVDERFHKAPEWLKPLDHGPYAAFDISLHSSTYVYISLGGLVTDVDGRVVDTSGDVIAGLYAAGASAAHLPRTGAEYASGMSLGPGSYFARRAGRHVVTGSGRLPA